MTGIDNLILSTPKLIGKSKNSGVKTYQQFAQTGEKVLSSYNKNSQIPLKQVIFGKPMTYIDKSNSPITRNITRQDIFIKRFGEEEFNIEKGSCIWTNSEGKIFRKDLDIYSPRNTTISTYYPPKGDLNPTNEKSTVTTWSGFANKPKKSVYIENKNL